MNTNTRDERREREEVFVCGHCGNKTSHKLICSHSVDVPSGIYIPNTDDQIMETDYFFLFECKTCNQVSLKNVFSEEMDADQTEIPFDTIRFLYPPLKTFSDEIPKGLSLIIKESNKVKKLSTLAYVILIRKALEELCKDRGVKTKTLKEKLHKLVLNEKLPNIFGEAADKLRLLGNIGAHETNIDINKNEAELIEEFLISLIEYIYVVPSKLKKLDDALKKQKK